MYNIVIQHFPTMPQHLSQVHSLIPITHLTHSPVHLPSGNPVPLSSFSTLLICFLYCTWLIFFFFYLLCLASYSLAPSMSLKMARFHFFLWLLDRNLGRDSKWRKCRKEEKVHYRVGNISMFTTKINFKSFCKWVTKCRGRDRSHQW